MKYDEMGNPAFYLVEECGACSERIYTGRQPPWSWWRDSFWSTRWVLVFLQFWEPKKSWFMAIHGTYFMLFWLQGNKFKTDLNWTSILTKMQAWLLFADFRLHPSESFFHGTNVTGGGRLGWDLRCGNTTHQQGTYASVVNKDKNLLLNWSQGWNLGCTWLD